MLRSLAASLLGRLCRTQMKDLLRAIGLAGGGVYKRIDENRELLELLQTEAPQLLASYPWIESWFDSNDDFFFEIERHVDPRSTKARFRPCMSGSRPFPRPWPGSANLGRDPLLLRAVHEDRHLLSERQRIRLEQLVSR